MVANVNYPAGLPTPLIAAFSSGEQVHWMRNDVQTGPPRYQHLTDARPTLFNVTWSMDALRYQMFEAWYRTVVNFGSTPFNIDLDVGAGIKCHECYFDATYNAAKAGKRWVITAVLLAVEKQYDDDCTSQALVALSGISSNGDFSAVTSGINEIVEVTLPIYWGNLKYGTDFS